jgi:polyphenol oxidase
MVRVADCVPVLFFDPKHSVISLVHAGWKGAVAGIHTVAITEMERRFESDPKDIKVWMGPAIDGNSFVSELEPEQASDPAWQPFIKKEKKVYLIDIAGYIKATLMAAGIAEKNITIDTTSTYKTDSLYSHARSLKASGAEGRFAVIAKINE